MNKEYILIDRLKIVNIEDAALQKLAANEGRPLSEASIEARAVLQVVNYLYENNEYYIHKSPEHIKPGMIYVNFKNEIETN